MQNSNKPIWFHYMDNLRALALLLGIFFHAAIAYSPLMGDLWPAGDSVRSSTLDAITWFSHLFRMPLFFLISGFFSYMILEKRGIKLFLKNRSLRILLPFIIFLPLTILSFYFLISWALENVDSKSTFLNTVVAIFSDPNSDKPPFSTTHLWFLYNLFLFCLISTFLWRFKFFKSKWLNKVSSAKYIIILLPVILIPSLASVHMPHPAAERIYPELWSFGYYGIFYLLGFVFFQKQNLLNDFKPFAPWLLLISLALYYFWFEEISKQTFTMDMLFSHEFSWQDLPYVAVESIVSVFMTLVCLVYGKQFLNRKNTILRVFSQSSYWVYIVHMPILFMIQFLLLDTSYNLWIKFLVSSLGTLFIGLVSYYAFVKWTPIGWLLNGRK